MFAVAGAMSIPSAHLANSICPIAASASASKSSVETLFPDSACSVNGVMNSSADFVITTRTEAPDFFRCLTISADLYAAIPPVTPNKIFLLANDFNIYFLKYQIIVAYSCLLSMLLV